MTIYAIPPKFRRDRHVNAGPRRRYKSGGGTNTTTTQSGPPAQVLQNYQDVYNQAKTVASQPNQQYNGSVVAGFTPMQQAGFGNINTASNAAEPFLDKASQYTTNAATLLDPSHFGGTVAGYQSPYTQSVVDATQNQFNNTNAIQQNQLKGNAASAGAFGGDRQAVAQAVLAGQQQAQQAPVIAGLYNTGFQNATNAAQSNAWLNSQAGFGMGNLGNEAQSLGLTAANAQLQGGAQQQALAQQELNVPYQAWQASQGYPYQITNWLEGLATGTGGASGGVGSTTTPGPSAVSQIAGLGLTGIAGYNALKGAGAFGGASSAAPSFSYAGYGSGASVAPIGYKDGGGIRHHNLHDADAVMRRAAGGGMAGFGGLTLPPPQHESITVPDVAINMVPSSTNIGGSNGLLGGGGNLLDSNTGTTTTSDQTGGDSTIGSILKTAGLIAATVYGGQAGAAAGSAFNKAVHFAHGGGIEDFARRPGLAQVPVRPRGFDTGGDVTPGLSASVAGNPMQAAAFQSYNGLPTEQLQELAARFGPGSPQGAMVQRALQSKRMNPGGDAQPTVQGGMGYADGGEPEDDELPDLIMPRPGPSVPGGLAAGVGAPMAGMTMAPRGGMSFPTGDSEAHGNALDAATTERAHQVYRGLIERGMDPASALGFAANAVQESRANPATGAGDMGASHGLLQWRGDRLSRYIQTFGHPPEKGGMGEQLDYIMHEVSGPERRAWDVIRQSPNDPAARAAAISQFYERPKDTAAEIRRRASIAARLAGQFTQGAKHGGRIGYADGGGVGGFDSNDPPEAYPSGNADVPSDGIDPDWSGREAFARRNAGLPRVGIASDAANKRTYGERSASTRGVVDVDSGSSDTIPPPPPPPPDQRSTMPTAGMSANPRSDALEGESLKANPWEALLAAGLGIMGGTSPHAAVNIGQGGLAGLKNFQQQRQLAVQDQIRQDTAKTNAVWRAGQLGNLQDRTKVYQEAAASREEAARQAAQTRQDALDQRKQEMELRRQQAENGTFSFQPATQPDPNDPAKTVSGVLKLNNKTGTSEFVPTNTNPNKGGNSAGSFDEATADDMARRIRQTGNYGILSGLARTPNAIPMVQKAIAKQAQDAGEAPDAVAAQKMKFNAAQKLITSFASGPDARTLDATNTAVAHLATLSKLGTALHNGDLPAVNYLKNWWQDKTGSDAPNNFNAVRDIATDEVIKAVMGSGATGALADRDEIRKRVSGAQNPEQLAGVIKQYQELFGGRIRTLKNRWDTEKPPGINLPFEDKLLPETREALGLAATAHAPSNGGSPAPGAAPRAPTSQIPPWVRPGDQYSPSLGKARDAAGNIYGAP